MDASWQADRRTDRRSEQQAVAGLLFAMAASLGFVFLSATSPVRTCLGSLLAGMVLLLLSTVLLVGGIALERRSGLRELHASYPAALVARDSGRAFLLWFLGHNLAWAALLLLLVAVLLWLLGPQRVVLAVAAGAATAAAFALRGLLWRAPAGMLGLCWRSPAPLPEHGALRFAEATVACGARLRATAEGDDAIAKAQQGRSLWKKLQDIYDLDRVAHDCPRLALRQPLGQSLRHELLVRCRTLGVIALAGSLLALVPISCGAPAFPGLGRPALHYPGAPDRKQNLEEHSQEEPPAEEPAREESRHEQTGSASDDGSPPGQEGGRQYAGGDGDEGKGGTGSRGGAPGEGSEAGTAGGAAGDRTSDDGSAARSSTDVGFSGDPSDGSPDHVPGIRQPGQGSTGGQPGGQQAGDRDPLRPQPGPEGSQRQAGSGDGEIDAAASAQCAAGEGSGNGEPGASGTASSVPGRSPAEVGGQQPDASSAGDRAADGGGAPGEGSGSGAAAAGAAGQGQGAGAGAGGSTQRQGREATGSGDQRAGAGGGERGIGSSGEVRLDGQAPDTSYPEPDQLLTIKLPTIEARHIPLRSDGGQDHDSEPLPSARPAPPPGAPPPPATEERQPEPQRQPRQLLPAWMAQLLSSSRPPESSGSTTE